MESKKVCKYCGCDDENLLFKRKVNDKFIYHNECLICRNKKINDTKNKKSKEEKELIVQKRIQTRYFNFGNRKEKGEIQRVEKIDEKFLCECKLCGYKISIKRLAFHLRNKHKNEITQEQYYDKYIDTSDHICSCGKKLKFYSFTYGYRKTCGSISCQQKIHELAYFEKTGYKSPFENPEVVKKAKQTILEEYGVKNVWEAEFVKEKSKETKLERYDDENYCNPEKAKATRLERTKYDHNWKDPENRKKAKQTSLERYGDENYINEEKRKQTCLERYNVEFSLQSPEVIKKSNETKFNKSKEEKEETNLKRMKSMFENYGVFYNFQRSINGYSKISQELFWKIFERLPKDLQKETYFAELNREFMIGSEINNKIYFIDFAIPSIKFCLEFYGDWWHKNPKKYKHKKYVKQWKKDNYRECSIEQEDFLLYKIWESQYKENKDFWINEILFYINLLQENAA